MSLVINTEYYFDLESLFFKLPETAQQALGDRLMSDSAWKQVADRLGYTAIHIETLAAKHSSRAAHQMLREWSRRQGSTLQILRQTLRDVERQDIITLLDDIRRCKLTSS